MKLFRLAYFRLTIFYVLIVMTISVVFSVVLFQVSNNEIGRGLRAQNQAFRNMPSWQDIVMEQLDDIRTSQIEESANSLRTNLIYWNLIILVLSSVASYFLAKRTMKPIEEAVDAQNRFTADASHELRTPLTAMKTEIEVSMRDKNFDVKEAKKLLSSNLEEIGKLETLSNALLKLAKSHEEVSDDFEMVSLKIVAEEAIEKVSKIAKMKNIEILNRGNDAEILGDKQSLVEMCLIFLDNAIKYSKPASKIIIKRKIEKNSVILSIQDSGIGIKNSDIPFVFNRFYRADNSRSKDIINGYGLGLSIAKSIIDMHEAKVGVKSTLGRGSIFDIEFKKIN